MSTHIRNQHTMQETGELCWWWCPQLGSCTASNTRLKAPWLRKLWACRMLSTAWRLISFHYSIPHCQILLWLLFKICGSLSLGLWIKNKIWQISFVQPRLNPGLIRSGGVIVFRPQLNMTMWCSITLGLPLSLKCVTSAIPVGHMVQDQQGIDLDPELFQTGMVSEY